MKSKFRLRVIVGVATAVLLASMITACRHSGQSTQGTTVKLAQDIGLTPSAAAAASSKLKEDIAFYKEIVDIETQWLADLVLPNGALPMTPIKNGTVKLNPYFADFAAMAILEGDKKHVSAVKRYMDWHFAHLNSAATDYNGVNGTIYDYNITVSDGKVQSETIIADSSGNKQYDSTDSYAANFLSLLWNYYQKTGDGAYIKKHYVDINRIIHAMYSTMDSDCLTTAKPDYAVKYLMDNCEVFRGMDDAVKLYEKVLISKYNDAEAMLIKLKADRDKVAAAIENKMWNNNGNYYECALFKNGSVAYSFDWGNFYPSATAQVFVISNGVVSPDSARAKLTYDNFNIHYSTGQSGYDWNYMSIPDAYYWGELVYVAAIMQDEYRVKSYMTLYRGVMKDHAYPLYNADAGKVTRAAAYMIKLLSAKL